MLKTIKSGCLIGIGYMLSPLSWWNDLFFNLPIAYAFGYLISRINPDWFLPCTILGYWISNILGIMMMQIGATDIFWSDREKNLKQELLVGLGSATAYTILIVGLAYLHVLELPKFLRMN